MSESDGNNLSSRERNLLGLQSGREEEEISAYLNSLDRTDLLLIRDIYYLFCGGNKSKQEKAITEILNKGGKIKMKESEMFRANKILEANKIKLEMKKKRTEKKKTIEPCGTMIPIGDIFKFKSKNIGIFPKPKIERKDGYK